VAPDAQEHGIEGRPILPIADMVELKTLLRFTLLATVGNANKSGMANS
jgi:hypothetical protein